MDIFLRLLCFLLIGAVATNAALLPAQVYWHAVLPNTRMPAALSELLNPGKGAVSVGASNAKPKYAEIKDVFVKYGHVHASSTEEQLDENLQVNVFFLEKDLHPGSKMTLQFDKINGAVKFLSRSEAKSIPFSSKDLPEIITRFSVQPGSDEEKVIKKTLRECEEAELKGEKKMCATSIESIVDFTIDSLGTSNVVAISTSVHSKNGAPRQEYTIIPSGVKNIAQSGLVGCHQQAYPYAVFYCHLTKSTKSYTVKMTGKDGTVVDAVAVCHTDTSEWNPKHLAFQMLNVKPGGAVPVCHFMPQNHVVFSLNI